MDSICCHKYTKVNNCVVHGVLVEDRLLSKSEKYVYTFQKSHHHALKNCYKLCICVAVSPSVLFAVAEFSWKIIYEL